LENTLFLGSPVKLNNNMDTAQMPSVLGLLPNQSIENQEHLGEAGYKIESFSFSALLKEH
jgi:hypothetical protein